MFFIDPYTCKVMSVCVKFRNLDTFKDYSNKTGNFQLAYTSFSFTLNLTYFLMYKMYYVLISKLLSDI